MRFKNPYKRRFKPLKILPYQSPGQKKQIEIESV